MELQVLSNGIFTGKVEFLKEKGKRLIAGQARCLPPRAYFGFLAFWFLGFSYSSLIPS